jgi:hypothetical protein
MKTFCFGVVTFTTIVFSLLLLPALLMSLFAPMAFDSGQNATVWLLVLSIWSFPVVALCSIGLSWFFYKLNRYRSAIAVSLLPLINVTIVAAIFGFF